MFIRLLSISALIACADAVNFRSGADVHVHSTAFAEQAGNVSVDGTGDVVAPSILLNNSFEHRLHCPVDLAEWLSNGASVHQIPQGPTTWSRRYDRLQGENYDRILANCFW